MNLEPVAPETTTAPRIKPPTSKPKFRIIHLLLRLRGARLRDARALQPLDETNRREKNKKGEGGEVA
jgi:hypothetical protein